MTTNPGPGVLSLIGHTLSWLGVACFAGLGALEFYGSIDSATSAPQQAAGAAMAMCWAIIPYVLARALDEAVGYNRPRQS